MTIRNKFYEVTLMRNRQMVLRALLAAGVTFALAAPASAGMGGISAGGIGVGVPGGGMAGGLGAASGALATASGALGGVSLPSAPGRISAGHLPIGAGDGPANLSASSGHSPFGSAKASSAWASLPALDNNIPGLAVPAALELPSAPALPSLSSKSAPALPSIDVRAKADVAGTSKSVDINTASLGGSPSLPSAPSLPDAPALSKGAPSASALTNQAKGAQKTAESLSSGKLPKAPAAADVNKTIKSESLAASALSSLATQETQSYVATNVSPIISNATSPSAGDKGKAVNQAVNQIPSPSQEQQNLSGTENLATSLGQSTLKSETSSLK